MIKRIKERVRVSVALGVAVTLLAGAGCTRASTPNGDGGPVQAKQVTHRTSKIYAAVIRRLVMKDDTFGGSNPHFKRVFVLEAAVPGAGDPMRELTRPTHDQTLSAGVKHEMLRLLSDLPRVRFVSRRGSVIGGRSSRDPIGHVVHGGVLITLGPIRTTPSGVQVPNNLWVSGLAGQWLTYVLQQHGSHWQITGTTGSAAIS